MRVNQGQEFVIGGYTPRTCSFDALIFGYYDQERLIYVGRTRNGFTPRSRLDTVSRSSAEAFLRLELSAAPDEAAKPYPRHASGILACHLPCAPSYRATVDT